MLGSMHRFVTLRPPYIVVFADSSSTVTIIVVACWGLDLIGQWLMRPPRHSRAATKPQGIPQSDIPMSKSASRHLIRWMTLGNEFASIALIGGSSYLRLRGGVIFKPDPHLTIRQRENGD